MHIDCFSIGLDEIPHKEVTTDRILSILHKKGRFSIFEATANQTIARAMTAVVHGHLVEIDTDLCAYPWTYVRLTPAGLSAIGVRPKDGER